MISAACAGSSGAEAPLTFNPDSSVTEQAITFVTATEPRTAARQLVTWLADAPAEEREFSRAIAREVFRIYTSGSDSTAMSEFATALEAAKDSLDLEGQVKVFVAVSRPATLGKMLRNDPNGAELTSLICREYATDTVSLNEFINAYKSE